MKKFTRIVLIAIFMINSIQVFSQCSQEDIENPPAGSNSLSIDVGLLDRVGQSFTSNSDNVSYLNSAAFDIDLLVAGVGLSIEVREGEDINGPLLASNTSLIVLFSTELKAVFSTPVRLEPNSKYTVVVNGVASVVTNLGTSTDTYPGGRALSAGAIQDFIFKFETSLATDAPVQTAVTNMTSDAVNLNWNAVPTATSYQYEVYATGDDPEVDSPIVSGSTNDTFVALAAGSLAAETTYDSYITASCAAGVLSDYSNVITFMTYRVGPYDYTCMSGVWVDHPEGDMNNPPSSVNDVVTVATGVAVLSSEITTKDLIINSNSELQSDFGISISGKLEVEGMVSGEGTIVLLPSGAASEIRYDQFSQGVKNLRIENPLGASIGAPSVGVNGATGNEPFIVSGVLDLAGGGIVKSADPSFSTSNITFASDVNATGSIVGAGGTIDSQINVCVERYISGQRAFRFLAGPLAGPSIFESWQENGASPVGYGTHITGVAGTPNTAADVTTGFDPTTTGNFSMFDYDPAQGWGNVDNTKTELHSIGKGYRLIVRGDRNVDISINDPMPVETVLRICGPASGLQQTDYTQPLVTGYNLVANPYQASVDMAFVARTAGIDAMYYWDPLQGTRGAYSTILIPEAGTTPGELEVAGTVGNATNIIEPGASFFLNSPSNGNVFFEIDDKVSRSTANNIFRSSNVVSDIRVKLFESNRFTTGLTAQDGLIIRMASGENDGIDGRDAVKIANLDESISVMHSSGQLLAIETRSMPLSDHVINLNVANYTFSNYTLDLSVPTILGMEVALRDNYSSNITLLNQGVSTQVSFQVDSNIPETTAVGRFDLVFTPVTLGTDDLIVDNKLVMYPNPVSAGVLNINVGDTMVGKCKVSLYNTVGQQVVEKEVEIASNGVIVMDKLSNLNRGVYILNLNDGENTVSEKIVIE